jgi:hypothetical protein
MQAVTAVTSSEVPESVLKTRAFVLLLIWGASAPLMGSTSRAAEPPRVREFLNKTCYDCHDADTKKGGLDLTSLKMDFGDPENFNKWVYVFDRVHDGEMPPPKKKQPERADKDAALAALGNALTAADRALEDSQGRSSLRRLSNEEFENSLRDLLSLPALKVKDNLPADGKSHGFDRLSSALDISYVHMESYLSAIDKALNAALCPFVDRPPVFKYRFNAWDDQNVSFTVPQKEVIGLVGMKRDPTFEFDVKTRKVIDDEPKATAVGLFRHSDADKRYPLNKVAPVLTGWHKLRLSGYSFWWDGKEVVPTQRHGAVSFDIFSSGEHFGTVDLPPNEPQERELTVWLERGFGKELPQDTGISLNPASVQHIRDFYNLKKAPRPDVHGPLVPVPGVALQWIELEGPFYDQWPPASHVAMFGDLPIKEWSQSTGVPMPTQQQWPKSDGHAEPKDPYGQRGQKRIPVYVAANDPAKDADRLLRTFLRRAFRRPVSEQELAGYVAKVTSGISSGMAFQDAMVKTYRSALASPGFLFLREPVGKLDDYALASRLSYFLWSSMPDDELLELADRGELSKPDVLRAQTERMLKDPKSTRFVEDFTGQWLNLRDINATQPDKKLYPENMPWTTESMVMETHAYFTELLDRDLGAVNIVKSDFAMLNEPLAELYGIKDVRGWDIRRVPLPADSHRGGFLTQGSVLKVTAAGTTTSPVKRGVFVLEKLLGIVPKPPPPGVGAIEPDVRGATTIREQLDKHRRNATCAGCHAKMDPYGFALESFDVTGGWRDRYRAVEDDVKTLPATQPATLPTTAPAAHPFDEWTGQTRPIVNGNPVKYHLALPVDCTGVLPDGRAFKDVDELRDLLASNPERLARAFTEQLITYSTGAEVSFADRAVVDDILQRTKPGGYGLRSILLEVVQSELFRKK